MDILTEIRTKRAEAVRQSRLRVSMDELKERLSERSPLRSFRDAMQAPGIRIIAELKKASPSRGVMLHEFNPEVIARDYQAGGAAALSVLTEPAYFQGSLSNLSLAREVTSLPVLQKDFIFSEYQLYEGANAGADAVLLIVRMLSEQELFSLYEKAVQMGLVPVVEVHDRQEATLLKQLPQETFVGINNRNLQTFDINVNHAVGIIDLVKEWGHLPIIFSGIRGKEDIAYYSGLTNMFLIGEHLVTSPHRQEALRGLVSLNHPLNRATS